MMKWFKRKKTKSRNVFEQHQQEDYAPTPRLAAYRTPPAGAEHVAKLAVAPHVLAKIFSFVCPHTQDNSYESCEDSALEDACMLCDLRDLAHCAQVSKLWRNVATTVLYHSIRIDVVHYCEREEILAEKRKRRSKFNRNAEPENTAHARLQLLCRTLRNDASEFAKHVQFLKLAYMTRETSKPDLARTVAVLPNLRYVDLPDGFFSSDPSCTALKQELQASCPDIRKMRYVGGGERSLELLIKGNVWNHLEVLELSRLNVDPTVLRQVLGSLPYLRALKITDMKSFHDGIFQQNNHLPPFPPVVELIFEDTPNLTADGLAYYLSSFETQRRLETLALTSTGVHPSTLHKILSSAHSLRHLSIIETVSASFPTSSEVVPLASESLQTLHYEISASTSANTYSNTTSSYYDYLRSSLVGNGLPMLESLYVRDPEFPETLIDMEPPAPAFASDPDNYLPPPPGSPGFSNGRPMSTFSSNNPFASYAPPLPQHNLGLRQPLEVYSKGLDEMTWNFSSVKPAPGPGRRGSATIPRPTSSHGLTESAARPWVNNARRSLMVANGAGGFLAVPGGGGDGPRPQSSGGENSSKRGSQYDIWR
ncbi:F-box domain-containing protein [Phlyctema vagabunda]|uniref:F-box domain-containing protein n=1 Tax=Phlyctema vagabunda TaxID=108571 RepID=A0ABR4PI03_9HELO